MKTLVTINKGFGNITLIKTESPGQLIAETIKSFTRKQTSI